MDDDREDRDDHDDREVQVRSALTKGLLLVAGIAVVIALGTVLSVKALGLGEDTSTGPVGADQAQPPTPLPSTALPVPSDTSSPSMTTSPTATPGKGDIELGISPVRASPMQRLNLTGKYPGNDNVALEVQVYDNGTWKGFAGVQAQVHVGTFTTYVQTGTTGENRFRVFDPSTGKGSNVVLVTIG